MGTCSTRQPLKVTAMRLDPALHKALRVRCAELECTMQDFVNSTLAKTLKVKLAGMPESNRPARAS